MSNQNLIAGAFYCVQSKIASCGTSWPIIQIIREFGIRKLLKKLVISLLFCKFIVEDQQLIKQI